MADTVVNWSGNVVFEPATVARPESVEQLQDTVAGATDRVRVLGTGHSFSPLVVTAGTSLDVRGLPERIELDDGTGEVTVSAGTTYGVLGRTLQRAGRALPNTGSLTHISVAGACSTGTHGSGLDNQVLAGAVTALELVTADGELRRLGRREDPGVVDGAVVALGTLGVVVAVTLQTEPTYDVAQQVWTDLPFGTLVDRFDEVMGTGYSVSAFTTWTRPDVVDQLWVKRRGSGPPPGEFGATAADRPLHPVPGADPAATTDQLGVPGPWNTRLPHFRLEFTPSSGEELQTEYFVARSDAPAALSAVREIAPTFVDVLQIGEIRTVAADGLWLSPAHDRDTVAIHFTWVDDVDRVLVAAGRVEAALAPFAPRPHWAKVHTVDPGRIREQYPRLAQFQALRERLDPARTFGNDETDRLLGP